MSLRKLPLKSCSVFFLSLLFLSCQKTDSGNGTNNNPPIGVNGDAISDRLLFLRSSKNSGKPPQGATGTSLKISFKDTLYLVDQVLQPIKFLHDNTLQNVAGVYLQVRIKLPAALSDASYYYDVPEVNETVMNDTVSIMMIGINPIGLNLPSNFEMTIVPYDKDGNPIAQGDRPVKVIPHHGKLDSAGCDLTLAPGEYWDWDLSYSLRDTAEFVSSPSIVTGEPGQFINGSCCAGISIYGICPGLSLPNSKLHFRTFYQIASETFEFAGNGTYSRHSAEIGANPLPDQSDFCGSGEGVIQKYEHNTSYTGSYSMIPATIPPDLALYHDSLRVAILSTQSSPAGGGFGNGGGVIHQFDCNRGSLTLIQVDIEGAKEHLYKYYTRRSGSSMKWFPFVN